jgi:Family of unknown function (DUF5759)
MSGPNPPRLEASSLFVEQNKKDHIRCEIYNTILSRVHQKIQGTNRLPGNTQQLIYLVPEFIPGVPRFDMKECIIYLAYNLRSSGFFVNYTHPNALYISWKEQARNYRIMNRRILSHSFKSLKKELKNNLKNNTQLRLLVLKRKSLICGKLPITRLLRGECHNMYLKPQQQMIQQPRMFILSK